MKKTIGILLALVLVLTACSTSNEGSKDTIKIGVSPVPHEAITKKVAEILEKEGVKVEISVFDDYVQPNLSLEDGSLDANFFQHEPYLNTFNEENGTNLSSIGGVHIEPIAFYSTKYDSLDSLPDGAEILIPADSSNGSRALLLLAQNGLIEIDDSKGAVVTDQYITNNPKNIKFTPVEAGLIPGTYADVDGAVINSNYAIPAGLNPLTDGIVIEDSNSPYANVIAVKTERKDEEIFKKLIEAFQSEEVKEYIEKEYDGSIIPAF